MINFLIKLAILALLILGIILCIPTIIDRVEIQECYKWVEQAGEYPKFYLLNWQKKQCESHNIHIDVPVID